MLKNILKKNLCLYGVNFTPVYKGRYLKKLSKLCGVLQ